MSSSKRVPEPVLSVPEVLFPENRVPHSTVTELVQELYAPLLERHPGDEEYQRDFVAEVRLACRMAGALSIDAHPLHLPLEEILRPRGWQVRNEQAVDAFRSYAPAVAKQAIANAQLSTDEIDAVLVETATAIAMPPLAYTLVDELGLRADVDVIPITFMGCTGGAHSVARARDYVLAHPQRRVLVVNADYASPHFHLEPDLRGGELRGSVVSSTLFSDGTSAAVMSCDPRSPGFRIHDTMTYRVADTQEAVAWAISDEGPRFRLTEVAMKLIPEVAPTLHTLLQRRGWSAEDLAVCSFHSGGDRIIRNLQQALGLSDHHVGPTRECLRRGNTMSVAVMDAMNIVGTDPVYRPKHGEHGIGAGFGPGFNTAAFSWTFHDVAA